MAVLMRNTFWGHDYETSRSSRFRGVLFSIWRPRPALPGVAPICGCFTSLFRGGRCERLTTAVAKRWGILQLLDPKFRSPKSWGNAPKSYNVDSFNIEANWNSWCAWCQMQVNSAVICCTWKLFPLIVWCQALEALSVLLMCEDGPRSLPEASSRSLLVVVIWSIGWSP